MNFFKRLCFLCVMTLLLSVPVSASEPTVYTFYFYEPPVVYSESVFLPEDPFLICEGLLPSGVYNLFFDIPDEIPASVEVLNPIAVVFTELDGVCSFYGVVDAVLVDGSDVLQCQLIVYLEYFDNNSTSLVFVIDDSPIPADIFASVRFETVDSSGFSVVMDSLGNVSALVSNTFGVILSNPVLTLTTGGGLTGVGVLIYKRLRRGV